MSNTIKNIFYISYLLVVWLSRRLWTVNFHPDFSSLSCAMGHWWPTSSRCGTPVLPPSGVIGSSFAKSSRASSNATWIRATFSLPSTEGFVQWWNWPISGWVGHCRKVEHIWPELNWWTVIILLNSAHSELTVGIAPEVLNGQRMYNESVDIFPLGLIFAFTLRDFTLRHFPQTIFWLLFYMHVQYCIHIFLLRSELANVHFNHGVKWTR